MTPQDKQYVDYLYGNLLKKINQKEILYSDAALTGPVGCCYVFGINYLTGNLYYKNSIGTWSLAESGGTGGGGITTPSILSRDAFIIDSSASISYTIDPNYILEQIIIMPVADCHPYCGFALGTPEDIVAQDLTYSVTPTTGAVWTVNILAISLKTIVVSAVPAGSKVVFIKVNIS